MSEFLLAEKPCLDELKQLGWTIMPPKANEAARDGLNQAILREEFLQANVFGLQAIICA
jgi:hypothetical protein